MTKRSPRCAPFDSDVGGGGGERCRHPVSKYNKRTTDIIYGAYAERKTSTCGAANWSGDGDRRTAATPERNTTRGRRDTGAGTGDGGGREYGGGPGAFGASVPAVADVTTVRDGRRDICAKRPHVRHGRFPRPNFFFVPEFLRRGRTVNSDTRRDRPIRPGRHTRRRYANEISKEKFTF